MDKKVVETQAYVGEFEGKRDFRSLYVDFDGEYLMFTGEEANLNLYIKLDALMKVIAEAIME